MHYIGFGGDINGFNTNLVLLVIYLRFLKHITVCPALFMLQRACDDNMITSMMNIAFIKSC